MMANDRLICYMVMDLQFGSTGKGLLAGHLAHKYAPDTVCTAWAANAGHTYIDTKGRKFVHTMLANGIVSPNLRQVMIGPGSIINSEALRNELEQCKDLLTKATIFIHPHAAVITSAHIEEESQFHAIGSTKKGVGAALCQRIRREKDSNIASRLLPMDLRQFLCTPTDYRKALMSARVIQIEGAQGHSLSLYHGFYPYVTSRDVSPAQVMADCGIPAHWLSEVMGTFRTYPIRVANRYDAAGNMIGWSGPWYPDQEEIQWSALNREPELTTVTKLPRRIATFSLQQLQESLWQTGTTKMFMNFANYLDHDASVLLMHRINQMIDRAALRGMDGIKPWIRWVGVGPTESSVMNSSDYLNMTE